VKVVQDEVDLLLDAWHSIYEEDLLLEFTKENIAHRGEGKQVKRCTAEHTVPFTG
jgi:hypothetical protein